MENEILLSLHIEIGTRGEQAQRDSDPNDLPGISLFTRQCNSLMQALALSESPLIHSFDDIDDLYPNGLWYATMNINAGRNLSFLEAQHLITIFENFSLHHNYKLMKVTVLPAS